MLGQRTVQVADPARHVQRDEQQQEAADEHERQTPGGDRRDQHAVLDVQQRPAEDVDVDIRQAQPDQHRRGDHAQRQHDQHRGQGEVEHPQRQHQHEVQQRAPHARIREQFADAREQRPVAVFVARAPRHAFAEHGLDQATLDQRQDPHRAEEQDQQRDADDRDRQARRQRQPGHHPGEIEDAGGQRQHHVEQRRVGVRVGHHPEEAAERRLARRRRRRAQRRLHLRLGIPVDVGDLVGCAVAAGDRGDHFGLGLARVLRQFRAQVFLRVVQGVLHQRRVGAGQGFAQAVEVRGNGGGKRCVHADVPFASRSLRTESTESRVARQAAAHSPRAMRPIGVMR